MNDQLPVDEQQLAALIELLTAKMSAEETQECATAWESLCGARGWPTANQASPAVASCEPKFQPRRPIPGELRAVSAPVPRSLSAAKESVFDHRMALQMALETMTDTQFTAWQRSWEEYMANQQIATKLLEGLTGRG